MRETRVRSLGWEDPLEKEVATHSSTLAWRIPWKEEPGRLQSTGSQRAGHNCVTSLSFTLSYLGSFQESWCSDKLHQNLWLQCTAKVKTHCSRCIELLEPDFNGLPNWLIKSLGTIDLEQKKKKSWFFNWKPSDYGQGYLGSSFSWVQFSQPLTLLIC